MKKSFTEYVIILLGAAVIICSQLLLNEDLVLRLILTIVGIAIISMNAEIAQGLKKGDK